MVASLNLQTNHIDTICCSGLSTNKGGGPRNKRIGLGDSAIEIPHPLCVIGIITNWQYTDPLVSLGIKATIVGISVSLLGVAGIHQTHHHANASFGV